VEGDREGLKAAVGPQIFEDMLNMISHGHRADIERIRNPLGGLPPGQQAQDFSLPFTERKRRGMSGTTVEGGASDAPAPRGDVAKEVRKQEPVFLPGGHGQ